MASSDTSTVSDMSKKADKCTYNWTLHKVSELCSKYESKECFRSPIFTQKDGNNSYEWQVAIYPNGKDDDTVGYLDIYLHTSNKHEVMMDVSFYAKNSDDKLLQENKLDKQKLLIHTPPNKNGFGVCKFLTRGALQELKDDILKIRVVISKHVPTSNDETFVPEKCILKNMKADLENKTFTNFMLEIGDFELPVHDLVIATRSSVFFKMLKNDTAEKKAGCVSITDIDKETMIIMVYFMYTNEIKELTVEEAKKLLHAADKYNVTDLVEICENTLKDELKVSNAIDILLLADKYHASNLRAAAIDVIVENHFTFLNKRSSFKAIKSPKFLMDIALKMSELLSTTTQINPKQLFAILLKTFDSVLCKSEMGPEVLIDILFSMAEFLPCETLIGP